MALSINTVVLYSSIGHDGSSGQRASNFFPTDWKAEAQSVRIEGGTWVP